MSERKVELALFDDRKESQTNGEYQKLILSPEDYFLVTIPPFIWNGFKGLDETESIIANCISLPHNENEMVRKDPLINILVIIGVLKVIIAYKMPKTKLLIIGYSSFVRRRIEPSLKKNKLFDYCISSKSNKINKNKKILFNNYEEALKKFVPEIVYISTVNSLHYSYAKKILNKGFNIIIDKPATLNIKTTKTLSKIAKKKKTFFS